MHEESEDFFEGFHEDKNGQVLPSVLGFIFLMLNASFCVCVVLTTCFCSFFSMCGVHLPMIIQPHFAGEGKNIHFQKSVKSPSSCIDRKAFH